MMQKFKLILFFTYILSLLGPWVLASTPIDNGDILQVYITDRNGSDLLVGTFTGTPTTGTDPHQFRVSNEGRIHLPNIGTLKVAGYKPTEVENKIKRNIGRYIKLKDVAVLNVTPKFNRIYVLGEVTMAGMYKVDANKPHESRLMNVINMAGGFTERSNQKSITIIKPDGSQTEVNLYNMLKNKSTSENIKLQDKDTVMVSQSFSRVYVLGEINRPGGYAYIEGATFEDYIAEAGGAKTSAAFDNIGIIQKDNGKNKIYKVSLSDNIIYRGEKKIQIKPGNVIYLPRSIFADWKDIATVLGMARDTLYIYDTAQDYSWN